MAVLAKVDFAVYLPDNRSVMPTLRIPYILLTASYCAGIFWLSAQSDPPVPDLPVPGLDKVAHATIYGGLALVLSWGLRRSNRNLPFHWQFWLPILFAAFYGITDEIHQLFVPHREFDLLDWAADIAGAGIVQAVLYRWVWKPNGIDSPESVE
jgi:VanZ family protein